MHQLIQDRRVEIAPLQGAEGMVIEADGAVDRLHALAEMADDQEQQIRKLAAKVEDPRPLDAQRLSRHARAHRRRALQIGEDADLAEEGVALQAGNLHRPVRGVHQHIGLARDHEVDRVARFALEHDRATGREAHHLAAADEVGDRRVRQRREQRVIPDQPGDRRRFQRVGERYSHGPSSNCNKIEYVMKFE